MNPFWTILNKMDGTRDSAHGRRMRGNSMTSCHAIEMATSARKGRSNFKRQVAANDALRMFNCWMHAKNTAKRPRQPHQHMRNVISVKTSLES